MDVNSQIGFALRRVAYFFRPRGEAEPATPLGSRLVKRMVLGHTGPAGEVAEWLKAAVC